MNIRSNPDTTLPAVTTGALPSSRKIWVTPDEAPDIRVPLREIAIADPDIAALYERKLVLVRPDGHVAWRGDALPADTAGIVERMRGAAETGPAQGRPSAHAERL